MFRLMKFFSFLAFVVGAASLSTAAQGDPVALIRLPGGGIAIESMWNLSVVITDSQTRETSNLAGVDVVRSNDDVESTHDRLAIRVDRDADIDHVLDRAPDQDAVSWTARNPMSLQSPNAILVQNSTDALVVTVDGIRIAHVTKADLDEDTLQVIRGCDVVIADVQTAHTADAVTLAQRASVGSLVLASADGAKDAKEINGNTLIVRSDKNADSSGALDVVVLTPNAMELSAELTSLLERKEKACMASQDVFRKLSVEQMNFKPANGSHTPRWNAEHMMGRELLFFSQIYHQQDSEIPVMDLNPKQMPPDYRAKHADWSGAEEARQMQRVSDFTRRFAFLLHDLPLDEKPPGSSWTPRRLLLQMERHYNEHTANVKKKFELPDWPKSP
ncbi:MAG: DinB family protein [Pirellulaceae bacterium]|nr:DinB family protein [Pirellulaceae bacterium]